MKRVRKMLAMVLMFLLAVGSGISGIKAVSRSGSVNAYKNSDWANNVYVDELWDSENDCVFSDNINILYRYLTGKSNATISDVSALASQTKNASYLRSVVTPAGTYSKTISSTTYNHSYAQKQTGQGVIVRLGGLDWQVVYITKSTSGDTIATLYLANSYQEKFADSSSYDKGLHFGFKDGVLYSDWVGNFYSDYNRPDLEYASSLYGASYIRAVTLNNGGLYSYVDGSGGGNYSNTPSTTTATKSSTSVFTPFTNSDMTDILATPSEVAYQKLGQKVTEQVGWDYDLPNENWGVITNQSIVENKVTATDENGKTYYFYGHTSGTLDNKTMNYYGHTYYDAWKNDYLWLPSMSETGYTGQQGIWGLNVAERSFEDGVNNWDNISGVKNSSNVDLQNVYKPCWLRSGSFFLLFVSPSGSFFCSFFVFLCGSSFASP